MTFTITKGMNGRKVELIGKYSIDGIQQMYADFYNWKQQQSNSTKYRIASYERHLINAKDHKEIIDFGDYSYFGLIKANKKEWDALRKFTHKPLTLDV